MSQIQYSGEPEAPEKLPNWQPKTGLLGVDRFAPSQKTVVTKGVIEVGENAQFSINGIEFFLSDSTWVFGQLEIGSFAFIKGKLNADGICFASIVRVRTSVPIGSGKVEDLCWDV